MGWLDVGRQDVPPLLARSDGAAVAFIVIFVSFLIEIAAGFVTSKVSLAVGVSVLAVPAAIVIGLAVIQWWQVRSHQADRVSWAHLIGVGAAVFSWIAWPTVPSPFILARGVSGACAAFSDPSAGCLRRVSDAWHYHNMAWWLTGALILGLALVSRRSRIAAWGAIVIALAGCELAFLFLQTVLRHYHVSG